jgi:hypothetical protein
VTYFDTIDFSIARALLRCRRMCRTVRTRPYSWHRSVGLIVFIFSSISVCSSVLGASNETPHPLELTQVDLFKFNEWKSSDVSVVGLMLGMTRQEMVRVEEKRGYKILDPLSRRECGADVCDVFSRSERPLGVSIVYGENNKLQRITVDSFRPYLEEGGRNWSQDIISLKFLGETDRLVNHCSEPLRRRLLGREDKKDQKNETPFIYVALTYDRRGIVLRYTIDSRNQSKGPFDVSIDFIEGHP